MQDAFFMAAYFDLNPKLFEVKIYLKYSENDSVILIPCCMLGKTSILSLISKHLQKKLTDQVRVFLFTD